VPALVSEALELVNLRGGLVIPLEAYQLAITLEARGVRFLLEDGDLIAEHPSGALTDADHTLIRRWKRHLLAIAAYEAPAS
jgi:hypothetical protein